MKNISIFSDCFGCGVCAVACPKQSITMETNELGFLRPIVDTSCVNCGLCLKVCALNSSEVCVPKDKIEPYCAAAWSNDANTRYRCTSGGIAYEIEKHLISKGYYAVVVRYDIHQRKAEHYIATSFEELEESLGSKYLQSETFNAFRKLENGKKYIVVGTPCQIDSFRRYVRSRKIEENFILMDFFCHSVPSIKMWHSYLDMVGFKEVSEVKFRCKRNGWHNSTSVLIKGDKKEWFSPLSKGDLFYQFFLHDRCHNIACTKDCKYKQQASAADLRIGDLWGYKYMKNEEGVSALVAFTEKGKNIVDSLENCTLEFCDFNIVAELQMKKNAIPKRSYSFVLDSLSKGMPLKKVYKIAKIIELPDTLPLMIKYYWCRIPYKLGIKR